MNKADLRKIMMTKRDSLDPDFKANYDGWVCDELIRMAHAMNATKVHCYISIKSEINLRPFLLYCLENQIKTFCPKVKNGNLIHLPLQSMDQLNTGPLGTLHPNNDLIYEGNYDLIVVPGLAYNQKKYRLGYGGGFYDRFLKHHSTALKIGAFYPFQKTELLQEEDHDISLDQILVNKKERL